MPQMHLLVLRNKQHTVSLGALAIIEGDDVPGSIRKQRCAASAAFALSAHWLQLKVAPGKYQLTADRFNAGGLLQFRA